MKYVIINADDFGASTGINRGIVDCHTRGILTSTSMMVTGRAVEEAVSLSRDHPGISIGLHWDVWGEDEREFDLGNRQAVIDEFHRQLDEFQRLMGRMPSHIDSHRHAHRQPPVESLFRELVRPLGIPLRGDGQVNFIGSFYAQWEDGVTDLNHVGVEALIGILRDDLVTGWNEVSCHAGYRSPDFESIYHSEREDEVRTLTHPRIRTAINDFDIDLVSYDDFISSK
jgi:predicted glycoside hydrolase/deacetylase ChbG (UPF0249 family)